MIKKPPIYNRWFFIYINICLSHNFFIYLYMEKIMTSPLIEYLSYLQDLGLMIKDCRDENKGFIIIKNEIFGDYITLQYSFKESIFKIITSHKQLNEIKAISFLKELEESIKIVRKLNGFIS